MDQEIWRPIEGYEGLYEVSNLGRVRSIDREITNVSKYGKHYTQVLKGRLLKLITISGDFPYFSVGLCKNGITKSFTVHRLVAQAFIPNPANYPVVNHIDCDCQNNQVDNLEWCTQQHNVQWSCQLGRHSKLSENCKDASRDKVYCPELNREFASHAEAISQLGLHPDYVTSSVKNKGRKSERLCEVQHKYTIVRLSDKEDYFNYIESENKIIRPIFSYGRHALDLKTRRIFNTFHDLLQFYNIPEGTKSSKYFSQYDGYLPKYDCFLVDIGYRTNCPFTEDEITQRMNSMKCSFVRRFGTNVIRCDTTGVLYHSAKYAEKQLNMPNACIRERLALYNGYYPKLGLHFSEVNVAELSDEECLSIADSLAASCLTRSGPKKGVL